jgi:hypothetical protein
MSRVLVSVPVDGHARGALPSTTCAHLEVPRRQGNPAIAHIRITRADGESAVEKIVDRRSARTPASTG